MIRLICGGILCICCAYVGLGIKTYYGTRKKFYAEYLRFIETLHEEISFIKSPLVQILDGFCADRSGEFIKMLGRYRAVVAGGNVTAQAVSAAVNCKFITRTEKETVSAMLTQLGKLDAVTQLQNLANYKLKIAACSAECDKKSATVGALAFKLGILLGILAMIMVA